MKNERSRFHLIDSKLQNSFNLKATEIAKPQPFGIFNVRGQNDLCLYQRSTRIVCCTAWRYCLHNILSLCELYSAIILQQNIDTADVLCSWSISLVLNRSFRIEGREKALALEVQHCYEESILEKAKESGRSVLDLLVVASSPNSIFATNTDQFLESLTQLSNYSHHISRSIVKNAPNFRSYNSLK